MWTILVTLSLILVIGFLKFLKIWNYWKNKGIPYVNLLECFCNYAENIFHCNEYTPKLEIIYRRYPHERYIGFYQFFKPILLVRDAELSRNVTVNDFSYFKHHNTFISEDVDKQWSKTMFGMTDKWSETKKVVNPLFSINRMRHMIKPISDCAYQLIEHLKVKQGESHNVLDIMSKSGNDMFARGFFGVMCNSHVNEGNDFYIMASKAAALEHLHGSKFWVYYFCPILVKLLGVQVFPSQVCTFFQSIISEGVKHCNTEGKICLNFSQLLREMNKRNLERGINNGSVTEDDVVINSVMFSVAGIGTVGYTLTNLCYELAQNPRIQENVCNEIQETMAQCNGELTYESIDSLKYLENAMMETLRLYPPSGVIDRRCGKPYLIEPINTGEKPLYIEEGCGIWILHQAMQRDPKYYPDPDKFNPDRFRTVNAMDSKAFLPFGTGPRKCIGMRYGIFQIKCFLVHLLNNYRIKIPVNLKHEGEGTRGIKLQFEQRARYLCPNIVKQI